MKIFRMDCCLCENVDQILSFQHEWKIAVYARGVELSGLSIYIH